MSMSGQFQAMPTVQQGKFLQYPLNGRVGGLMVWSGHFGVEENLLFLSGIKPQFLRHPACNLVTVLAMLSQLFVSDQTAFQEGGINILKEFFW
jgi:hypothetical protein